MAPKRPVKINNNDFNKLTANDVICPICRGILIRPITLPCSHGFCSSCFETTIAGTTNNECPLCGVRIGSWLRSATKSNKLINETYWQAIQERFPSQVRNKLARTDGNSIECKYGMKRNCDNEVIETSQPKAKFNNNVVKSIEGNGCQLNIINKTKSIVDDNQSTNKPGIIRNSLHKPGATSVVNNNVVPNSSTITAIKNNQNKANVNQQASNTIIISSKEYTSKEYSCRILCQNVSSTSEKQHPLLVQNIGPESQKKSKLKPTATSETDSKGMSERSNSIESECLYFKPIDHRHNPPSEGLPPIKVPSRRPTPNANFKVIPPSGRNTLTISPLECAFAKLFIPSIETQSKDATNKNTDCHTDEMVIEKEPQSKKKRMPVVTERKDPLNSVSSTITRRSRRAENSVIAKIKKLKQRYPVVELEVLNLSEMTSPPFQGFKNNNDIVNKNIKNSTRSSTKRNNNNSVKKPPSNKSLQNQDAAKRIAQEKADYELAKKLQEQFNQLTTYVTRSSVSKCNSTKR